jgi:NAD(P)-dependent dehydrogenase (short-subunit alcohol dehydrogenase family)
MKLKPINQQSVVVFGASSGMGRETAKLFARRGAKVMAAARDSEALRSLVEEIRADGGQAEYAVGDVTDFEQVKAVADGTIEVFGSIDTWAHFAGVAVYGMFDELTPEEFKRVIDVNLTGMAYAAMAALPHMKREGRGAFIGVTSVLAKRSVPLLSAYSASKHGAEGLLESLRMELRREGVPISITNVMPSAMNSTFFEKARTRMGVKPKGTPPVYAPDITVDAVLWAAEHTVRDLMGGGGNQPMLLLQRISPRLLDSVMLPVVFRMQKTNEPKSADAPTNVFEPDVPIERVEGAEKRVKGWSAYTWLETHPAVRPVALGLVAGAAALFAVRRAHSASK